MRHLILSNIIFILLLALGCAQQTSPTGGPQDTIPPVLVRSSPSNKTINFKNKTIELVFDEAVMVNNPREQLLITPSLGNKMEMEARKNTVILNLNADLDDSTTYTINFRESIQDVTEKNPAQNLQLAFSTGSYLDSLSIKGNIYDLLSGKEVKDAAAALYTHVDTFNIFKHKPIYLTKSDDKGNFEFNNLKPGTYYIYAFNDKNKNLIVDSKTEQYGFLADTIYLNPDSVYNFQIPVVSLDARELKLISAKPYNTYFNIRASKNLMHYSIKPTNPDDSLKIEHLYGEDQTSIHLFFNTEPADSIPFHLTASDSIGNTIDTILYAKANPRKATPEKFNVTVDKPVMYSDKNMLRTSIAINKPIKSLNYDSIYFQVDSTHRISFNKENFTWNKEKTLLKLVKQIPQEELPQEENNPDEKSRMTGNSSQQVKGKSQINKLSLKKSFLISIDNDSSQSTEQPVNLITPENSGVIIIQVQTNENNFIIELINQNNEIQQQSFNVASNTFTLLPPANYQIRLVIDSNGNQKWDAGNFFKRVEPEPIIYYSNELKEQNVSIKANWELGPLLISYPNNVNNSQE